MFLSYELFVSCIIIGFLGLSVSAVSYSLKRKQSKLGLLSAVSLLASVSIFIISIFGFTHVDTNSIFVTNSIYKEGFIQKGETGFLLNRGETTITNQMKIYNPNFTTLEFPLKMSFKNDNLQSKSQQNSLQYIFNHSNSKKSVLMQEEVYQTYFTPIVHQWIYDSFYRFPKGVSSEERLYHSMGHAEDLFYKNFGIKLEISLDEGQLYHPYFYH